MTPPMPSTASTMRCMSSSASASGQNTKSTSSGRVSAVMGRAPSARAPPPAAGAAMRIVGGAGRARRLPAAPAPGRAGQAQAAMPIIAGASVITSTRSGGSRAKASASATSSQES